VVRPRLFKISAGYLVSHSLLAQPGFKSSQNGRTSDVHMPILSKVPVHLKRLPTSRT
jgi:hypothetical protein